MAGRRQYASVQLDREQNRVLYNDRWFPVQQYAPTVPEPGPCMTLMFDKPNFGAYFHDCAGEPVLVGQAPEPEPVREPEPEILVAVLPENPQPVAFVPPLITPPPPVIAVQVQPNPPPVINVAPPQVINVAPPPVIHVAPPPVINVAPPQVIAVAPPPSPPPQRKLCLVFEGDEPYPELWPNGSYRVQLIPGQQQAREINAPGFSRYY